MRKQADYERIQKQLQSHQDKITQLIRIVAATNSQVAKLSEVTHQHSK